MIETYADRLEKEGKGPRPTITASPDGVDEHHPIMEPQKHPWKYGEGAVLEDLETHIKATYSKHYTTSNNDIQTIDVFAYRGTLATTSIDNAIKYLMRYGKKKGKNETDLFKAMHYLILAIGYEREEWK